MIVESARRGYEQRLAQQDADVAKRETSLREREKEIAPLCNRPPRRYTVIIQKNFLIESRNFLKALVPKTNIPR